MQNNIVKITNISTLSEAISNEYFDLTWSTTGSLSSISNFKIYRYISDYPVDLTFDPKVDRLTNFVLISASQDNTSTTFRDTLNDLDLNGFTYSDGVWQDTNNNNVLTQIYNSERQIYYRILGSTIDIQFNTLPFVFICYEDGYLECLSTIQQVRWNTLYTEGEQIWLTDITSDLGVAVWKPKVISVDPITTGESNRTGFVWIGGNGDDVGRVARINIKDGSVDQVYQFSYPVYSLRIDPSTGDAFAGTTNGKMYRCYFNSPIPAVINNTSKNLKSTSNGLYALTLKNIDDEIYGYTITDNQYIEEWNLTVNSAPTAVSENKYGGRVDMGGYIGIDIPCVWGITTGPDGVVWANGYHIMPVLTGNRPRFRPPPPSPPYPAIPGGYPPYIRWDYDFGDYGSQQTDQVDKWKWQWEWEYWGGNPFWDQGVLYGVTMTLPPCCIFSTGGEGINCYNKYPYVRNKPGYELVAGNKPVDPGVKTLKDAETYKGLTEGIHSLGDIGGGIVNWTEVLYKDLRPTLCGEEGYIVQTITYTGEGADRVPVVTQKSTAPKPGNMIYTNDPYGAHLGNTADFPITYMISGNNYNVWQTNEVEDTIRKLIWNGSNLTADVSISLEGANGTAADSENNVWGISRTGSHVKIYQIDNGSVFPFAKSCRWPTTLESSDWNYGANNDKYVEYVLTRDSSSFSGSQLTLYNAISNAPNDAIKRELTRTFYNTYGDISGKYVYNLIGGTTDSSINITRSRSQYTYQPNSDEIGSEFIFLNSEFFTQQDIAHPDYILPTIGLKITPLFSTPQLEDADLWNDQKTDSNYNVSGYDDLTVQLSGYIINNTTFEIDYWEFSFGDKVQDICGDEACACLNTYPDCGTNLSGSGPITEDYTEYKYHDPSQSGLTGERVTGWPGEDSGTYVATATAHISNNCYGISGITSDNLIASSPKTVVVWERWPKAQFYLNTFNLEVARERWYDTTKWIYDENLSTSNNGYSLKDSRRIVSGYDPLSAQFVDCTIGRTWPVCAWYINFGSNGALYPVIWPSLTSYGYTDEYPYLQTARGSGDTANEIYYDATSQYAIVTTASPELLKRDSYTNVYNQFAEHVYFKPGTYYVTLYTAASNTNTLSFEASREVRVLESCPLPNFLTISAMTVSSNYTDEYNSVTAIPDAIAYINDAGSFISGYSPNLTITWMDSSVARSYPISSYEWNFGDYYDETHMLSGVTAIQVTSDYPAWMTDQVNHMVTHTYVMPGIYNVSLNAAASTTSTEGCVLCSKDLHVYVEEILPWPCFQTSLSSSTGFANIPLSGTSPLTVYFNPSCIIPGSFPICRIDWDFGDGSEITTSTRWPKSNNVYNVTAFPLDGDDPRNIIVSHVYTRTLSTQPSTFIVNMSAYACNTNSVSSTSGSFGLNYNVGPINATTTSDDQQTIVDVPKHLITSRMQDSNNVLLVFEGQNQTVLNYLLSTGVVNV